MDFKFKNHIKSGDKIWVSNNGMDLKKWFEREDLPDFKRLSPHLVLNTVEIEFGATTRKAFQIQIGNEAFIIPPHNVFQVKPK